jgi:hypothetical protein
MSAAAAWYTALAVDPPSPALTLLSSLNAPQKLVAPPITTLCGVAATLGFVVLGELVALWAVELGGAGVVDGFELATLLDPEEHPASTPTNTHVKARRRIVTYPFCGRLRHRTLT